MRIGSGTNSYSISTENQQKSKVEKEDSVIKGLQKQLLNAQTQLQKLADNEDMSPEQKMERRKELKAEITQYNQEITKRQIEIQKEEREEKASATKEQLQKTTSNEEVKEKQVETENMGVLLSANNSMQKAETIDRVKTQMSAQAHDLKGRIATAKEANKANLMSDLSAIESDIQTVTKDIIKEYGKVFKMFKNDKKVEESDENREDKKIEEEKPTNSVENLSGNTKNEKENKIQKEDSEQQQIEKLKTQHVDIKL